MFAYYSCDSCGMAFQVPKTDENLHLLSLRMRCPDNTCEDKLQICDREKWAGAWVPIDAEALFAACSGVGVPAERKCSPSDLEMLLGGTIRTMELEPSSADPNRSIISNMVVDLDLGKEESRAVAVYFAMSTHGATIYKVTDL